MPRIRQLEEKYAVSDFQTAVFTAMVRCGMECSVRQLAQRLGAQQSTLNVKLRHRPQALTVEELRRIVQLIKPDIRATLTLLGFSAQDMKNFKEDRL